MNVNGKLSIVGSISARPYAIGSGVNKYVSVIDLDGIEVASLSNVANEFYKYKVETFDGKNYDFFIKSQYNNTNTTFLYEFVCDLVSRGYVLGHQAKVEQQKLYQAKIDLAKDRSVNVYQKPGYLIDEDGKKYTVIISINFQMLHQKIKIDCTRMIEINQGSFFKAQVIVFFVVRVLRNNAHFGLGQFIHNLVNHSCFSASGSAGNSDNQHKELCYFYWTQK